MFQRRTEIVCWVGIGICILCSFLTLFISNMDSSNEIVEAKEPSTHAAINSNLLIDNLNVNDYQFENHADGQTSPNDLSDDVIVEYGDQDSNPVFDFQLTTDKIKAIDNIDNIAPFVFDLNSSSIFSITPDDDITTELLNVSQPFIEDGDEYSYLIINKTTGEGIGCNIDAEIYGASSFKIIFACYLLENMIETDQVSDSYKEYLLDLIYDSIVYSDNDAYCELRDSFSSYSFVEWLENIGVEDASYAYQYYPSYTVRDAVIIWNHLDDYMHGDNAYGQWLLDRSSETEVSFIRQASRIYGQYKTDSVYVDDKYEIKYDPFSFFDIKYNLFVDQIDIDSIFDGDIEYAIAELSMDDVDSMTYFTVYDKAGWIYEEDYNSICDAGLVYSENNEYIFAAFSDIGASSEGQYDFTKLAFTLLDVIADNEK